MKNAINEKYASPLRSSKIQHNAKLLSRVFFAVLRFAILISIGYIILYPLLYMIVTSFVSRNGFFNTINVWIPQSISIVENYSLAAETMGYGQALKSTFIYQIISALMEVALCAVTAYGFSRFRFRGRGLMLGILFLTILIPDMMIIIPRVANYSNVDFLGILGLFNKITGIDLRPNLLGTPLAFYLPSLLSSGLRSGILIFIYIQFFNGFPAELEEAAWIDGAGPFKTFFSIALPSSGVVIITVTVFSLIWHWNDSLLCSMYLNKDFPLAFQLRQLPVMLTTKGYYLNPETPETLAFQMAGCVMFVLPMLVIYIILQRWFIESIDRVGITG